MWQVAKSSVDARTESWQVLAQPGQVLAFAEVVRLWHGNEEFRAFWNASLREVQFAAYCWECPPITAQSSSRPFECVFVSSPMLSRMPPEPEPFSEYFRADCEVTSFESLGRDAWLVAPCPGGQGSNFSHLASFVATATEAQQSALWLGDGRGAGKADCRQAHLAQHRGRRSRLAARPAGHVGRSTTGMPRTGMPAKAITSSDRGA